MLLEHLLALPVGTHVLGDMKVTTTLPGVVEELDDGSHFIRWIDGYVTVPFGKIRDYDEYIAAHTQLITARIGRCHFETDRINDVEGEPDAQSDAAA
jgi:hypothetical protein